MGGLQPDDTSKGVRHHMLEASYSVAQSGTYTEELLVVQWLSLV